MGFLRAGQAARDAGRHLLTGPRSRALEALPGVLAVRRAPPQIGSLIIDEGALPEIPRSDAEPYDGSPI